MEKIINIPISLIRRNKDNKTDLEALACAVILKSRYQKSCLYGLQITRIMELFGVCHKKALRLKESPIRSELFIYNEKKDCLFAKSFKSKDKKRYGKRHKYDAYADYCRKLKVSEGMTLRKMVCELRNTLLLCAIHASEQDCLIVSGNKDKNDTATKPAAKRAIPQRKLAKSISMSKSSASRYVGKLVDKGVVGKSEIVAECVIDQLNDETESEYLKRNNGKRNYRVWHNVRTGHWSAWVVFGCVYSITSRCVSESFMNVIHNYQHRSNIVAMTSSELDGGKAWLRY